MRLITKIMAALLLYAGFMNMVDGCWGMAIADVVVAYLCVACFRK